MRKHIVFLTTMLGCVSVSTRAVAQGGASALRPMTGIATDSSKARLTAKAASDDSTLTHQFRFFLSPGNNYRVFFTGFSVKLLVA
jgi:hypothetical protein